MTEPPASSGWKDKGDICPPIEETMTSLQDEGKSVVKKVNKKERTIHVYPQIEKLAGKMLNSIKKHFNPEGLTKNNHRGKQPSHEEIVVARKHTDITEVPPAFLQCGKEGKVHLMTTSLAHAGIDVCVDRFQDCVTQQTEQKNAARAANDGLRLSSMMLDPQRRDDVSSVLSKKKTRAKSDIPGCPTKHFFEKMLTKAFLNKDCQVSLPPFHEEFPEDEKGRWNPSDPSIFSHERDADWLRGTWDDCIKPKHKKALDKWNKDTGGGDGTPPSFIDCCAWDMWLVWLLCKDHEQNFLLASDAGG